ncbi:hypothetical protein Bca4012_005203 [Brassica carinata]|uniref:X8 domain-containing protein n=6 Tax=Brassica TaxID=3705 RepID=A0A0D3BEA8_BRAOL|nr:PREDICTED: major pollen allergen Ole e 10-like [Brassica oleracea var. oleracea]KAG2293709.1 hypothetical protein Bca52824_040378 [Brassica carinata]CAF1706508.1 unnamed protein product [Brassica napus]CDY54368.1 BnaC03g74560D [Brassica napus]VDC94768.1 unnamed protein product [Brassica oleracea]
MFPQSTLIFFILSMVAIHHLPLASARGQWCVVSPSATDAQMQANIDWLCSRGHVDCIPIKPGGPCFEPDNLRSHVSFVMNQYYQFNGRADKACYFDNTGIFVFKDPSYGDCEYDY